MIQVLWFDVTAVSNTGNKDADKEIEKLLEFSLAKNKTEIETEFLKQYRNFILFGCTHPEIVYKELIDD